MLPAFMCVQETKGLWKKTVQGQGQEDAQQISRLFWFGTAGQRIRLGRTIQFLDSERFWHALLPEREMPAIAGRSRTVITRMSPSWLRLTSWKKPVW